MTLSDEDLRKHVDTRLKRVDPTWIAINDVERHNLAILNVLIKECERRKVRLGYSLRRRAEEALVLYQCFKHP
jgi:hypothetical protein